ncbi:hypothetical protein M918_07085 [Clostridium sp. BL8]|nr:hypothetical protein M918_07085 [Clostridium sp. BL8]
MEIKFKGDISSIKHYNDVATDSTDSTTEIARKYFYQMSNKFKCYKGILNETEIPVAKYIAERVLTLPLYPELLQ